MKYLFQDTKQTKLPSDQICESKNECKVWETEASAVYKVRSVLTIGNHKICFVIFTYYKSNRKSQICGLYYRYEDD